MVDLPTRDEVRLWLKANTPTAIAAVRRRPPVVTLALVVCIAVTWVRLEVNGQLPTSRFISDAYSGRALIAHHYFVLATSTILTRDIFMVVSICVSLLATMGSYEVAAGHVRAAGLAVFAAAVGPTSVLAAMALLDGLGSAWAAGRLDTLDIGASAIVAASSGAIAGIVRDKRLTGGLILFLLGGLAVHHQLADCEHMLIFPWGYLAGRVFGRARIRPSRASRRLVVIYTVVAACLLGVALPASAHLLPSPRTYRSVSGRVESPPRIIDTSYPTPSLGGGRRHVLVLLPPGYDSSRQHYPVVELLHGDPGLPQGMVSVAGIEASQVASGVAPFIGVAPDGNGPVVRYSWWANIPKQAMGTAVTRDLRTWLSKQFRINNSWSYAGLSSGGFGAAYLPLISSYPVHGVCGLGGFYTGNIPPIPASDKALQAQVSPIAHTNRVAAITFIAYGRSDNRSIAGSKAYIAALAKAHTKLVVKTYPGGHDWAVWKQAFLGCFRAIEPASGAGTGTSPPPLASSVGPTSPAPTTLPPPSRSPLPGGVSPARMVSLRYPAPSLGDDQDVIVLLPPGYDSDRTRHYPVVELLHGDPGRAAPMIRVAAIQASQVASGVAPFIGVAPEGVGSVVKYGWWANLPKQAMGTAVTRDLRTWLSKQFRINNSWSYAGLSSGGFGAAYLPLISSYPVHGVCGLSGFYTGNIPPIPASDKALQAQVSPIAHTNRVAAVTFISYGQSDERTMKGSQAYIAALGKARTRLVVKTYPGGHDWSVWKQAFLGCFRTIEPAS